MQALVDAYLAARRSIGFDLRIDGLQLCAFARFAEQTGHRGPLTVALAVGWARSARQGTRLTWARRLQTLRPFMKYRAQFDPATEIPPSGLFGPAHRRLVPHIYTEAEITALVNAAAQLRPVTGLRLRARTYATLFGLLASTGLRISEALALTPADVDLPGALLTVRNTKFRKSRIVPLHPTTVAALQRYVNARRRRVSDQRIATFLVSDQGTPLGDRMVHHTFATLRARLEWIGRGGYAVPRIHDLRQHAGSGIMPGASEEAVLLGVVSSISRLPIRHNPPLVFSPARWPRREKTCEIRSSRIARRFRSSASSTRTSTRSPRIWLRAATPPRRFAHSGSCSGISTSG
jgi:integrase